MASASGCPDGDVNGVGWAGVADFPNSEVNVVDRREEVCVDIRELVRADD